MAMELDDDFYARADAHIHLSNDQKNDPKMAGRAELVNASMMFATARFCTWVSAGGFGSGEAMRAGKQEIADFFVDGFRQMLDAHLDDYIRNFEAYMKPMTR